MQQFEELKALLGNSGTYYLIAVDMTSNYSYVNKRYADLFEPIYGNLVGKHYAITMHKDDLQTCQTVAELAFINSDMVFPATLRKHDGKGGYVITRWEYKAMFHANNEPAGIFCLGHDITELIQVSGELEQIKISQSHSIRRYVANIMGLGKLIQETTETSDLKDIAKMITESALDLDKVVRDLNHPSDGNEGAR